MPVQKRRPSLWLAALAVLLSLACGLVNPATPTPIVPAETLPPSDSAGVVRGKVFYLSTKRPLPGAGVILCWMRGQGCLLQPRLSATADANGNYEILNVPDGYWYIVLHHPGERPAIWDRLEGYRLDLSEKSQQDLYQLMIEENASIAPIFGEGQVNIAHHSGYYQTPAGVNLARVKIDDGAIISVKFQLTLEMRLGLPIRLEMDPGETVVQDVEVWNK